MKNTRSLYMGVAAAIAVLMTSVSSGRAQELVPAFLSAVAVSTNSTNGNLTYHSFGNRDIIRECASSAGLTNLQGLSLVYNRSNASLEVVSGTNQTLLCVPATFSGGTALSNTNGTTTQELTFVFWEGSTVANGTLSALEHTFTLTNGMTFFSLKGQLQFSAIGTNGPTIYTGSLVAGSSPFEIFGGRDDDR
jgi:hypothetical protein